MRLEISFLIIVGIYMKLPADVSTLDTIEDRESYAQNNLVGTSPHAATLSDRQKTVDVVVSQTGDVLGHQNDVVSQIGVVEVDDCLQDAEMAIYQDSPLHGWTQKIPNANNAHQSDPNIQTECKRCPIGYFLGAVQEKKEDGTPYQWGGATVNPTFTTGVRFKCFDASHSGHYSSQGGSSQTVVNAATIEIEKNADRGDWGAERTCKPGKAFSEYGLIEVDGSLLILLWCEDSNYSNTGGNSNKFTYNGMIPNFGKRDNKKWFGCGDKAACGFSAGVADDGLKAFDLICCNKPTGN